MKRKRFSLERIVAELNQAGQSMHDNINNYSRVAI
jgi:hypothetical protein